MEDLEGGGKLMDWLRGVSSDSSAPPKGIIHGALDGVGNVTDRARETVGQVASGVVQPDKEGLTHRVLDGAGRAADDVGAAVRTVVRGVGKAVVGVMHGATNAVGRILRPRSPKPDSVVEPIDPMLAGGRKPRRKPRRKVARRSTKAIKGGSAGVAGGYVDADMDMDDLEGGRRGRSRSGSRKHVKRSRSRSGSRK